MFDRSSPDWLTACPPAFLSFLPSWPRASPRKSEHGAAGVKNQDREKARRKAGRKDWVRKEGQKEPKEEAGRYDEYGSAVRRRHSQSPTSSKPSLSLSIKADLLQETAQGSGMGKPPPAPPASLPPHLMLRKRRRRRPFPSGSPPPSDPFPVNEPVKDGQSAVGKSLVRSRSVGESLQRRRVMAA